MLNSYKQELVSDSGIFQMLLMREMQEEEDEGGVLLFYLYFIIIFMMMVLHSLARAMLISHQPPITQYARQTIDMEKKKTTLKCNTNTIAY